MIATVLVAGKSASDREQAIKDLLHDANQVQIKSAILIEGLSDGKSVLESGEHTSVVRIAAGCLCCSNNMIMRIYLNRLIQQKPDQLFISLSTAAHLQQILDALRSEPYQQLLALNKVIDLNPTNT